jgi:hypothetical protein
MIVWLPKGVGKGTRFQFPCIRIQMPQRLCGSDQALISRWIVFVFPTLLTLLFQPYPAIHAILAQRLFLKIKV